MARKKSKAAYAADLRIVRRVIKGFDPADGFNAAKKLSPSQKGQITKAVRIARAALARENYIFRGKGKKLEVALEYAGIPAEWAKKFKVAPIPYNAVTQGEKPELIFSNVGLTVRTSAYDKNFSPFDPHALVENPVAEVMRAANLLPESDSYLIRAGEHQISTQFDVESIAEKVAELQMKYANSSEWLFGIDAYRFRSKTGQKKLNAKLGEPARKRRDNTKTKKEKRAKIRRYR